MSPRHEQGVAWFQTRIAAALAAGRAGFQAQTSP